MNQLIDVNELSKLLGVSTSTIKNYRKKGLPYYKNGRSVRYDYEEVKEWLRNG